MKEWPRRWDAVEAPSDCATLLPDPDKPACADARAALERLKKALPDGNRGTLIRASGELALAAQRAAEKLRKAGIAELLPEAGSRPALSAPPPKAGASRAAPSASAQRTPAAAPVSSGAHAHGARGRTGHDDHAAHDDHAGHDHTRPPENVHTNSTLSAILEYSRLASLALRHLATYLEHGPPDVRGQAFTELLRLSNEQPRWTGLESLAREARLTETDPALKAKLDNLLTKLRAERGL